MPIFTYLGYVAAGIIAYYLPRTILALIVCINVGTGWWMIGTIILLIFALLTDIEKWSQK